MQGIIDMHEWEIISVKSNSQHSKTKYVMQLHFDKWHKAALKENNSEKVLIWVEPQEMKALKDEYYQKLHCSSLKISFLSPSQVTNFIFW